MRWRISQNGFGVGDVNLSETEGEAYKSTSTRLVNRSDVDETTRKSLKTLVVHFAKLCRNNSLEYSPSTRDHMSHNKTSDVERFNKTDAD